MTVAELRAHLTTLIIALEARGMPDFTVIQCRKNYGLVDHKPRRGAGAVLTGDYVRLEPGPDEGTLHVATQNYELDVRHGELHLVADMVASRLPPSFWGLRGAEMRSVRPGPV
jgi:hypothetical protein